MKDYYKILDVPNTASNDEIKKAFRKKAKEAHPDKKSSGKSGIKMKEINEAYNVLKDEFSKKQYDLRYPFLFEEESHIFYDQVSTDYHPRSFYNEWKEDLEYRKVMIYLWVILGIILAMVLFLIFSLSAIDTGSTDTSPSPNNNMIPEDVKPKEIYEPYSPENDIREI